MSIIDLLPENLETFKLSIWNRPIKTGPRLLLLKLLNTLMIVLRCLTQPGALYYLDLSTPQSDLPLCLPVPFSEHPMSSPGWSVVNLFSG